MPKTDYLIWKQENNQYLYKRSVKSRYTEVPFDDALLFLSEKRNETLETAPPEEIIEKMENLNQLQKAFAGLTEEEKNSRKDEKFLMGSATKFRYEKTIPAYVILKRLECEVIQSIWRQIMKREKFKKKKQIPNMQSSVNMGTQNWKIVCLQLYK